MPSPEPRSMEDFCIPRQHLATSEFHSAFAGPCVEGDLKQRSRCRARNKCGMSMRTSLSQAHTARLQTSRIGSGVETCASRPAIILSTRSVLLRQLRAQGNSVTLGTQASLAQTRGHLNSVMDAQIAAQQEHTEIRWMLCLDDLEEL